MEIPPLDRASGQTLSRQILDWFRSAIRDGFLPAGERLPATRVLARQLGVGRNAVCEAYELLAAEGYVESASGSRSRVRPGVARGPGPVPGAAGDRIGGRGAASPGPGRPAAPTIAADFRTGRPDPASVPREAWARALRRAVEDSAPRDWLYGPPEGTAALRAEIAAYLFRARGIRADAEEVQVCAGATGALHTAALVLSADGRPVAVEDPGHRGMVRALRGAGVAVVPVPADEAGIEAERLEGIDAAAVYATPSHQFPLGGVLPAGRRTLLAEWARSRDAYAIEDDYDAEFRYAGPPVSPLWSTSPDRTIYIGTFSKTLFPALRIGYALVPPPLRERWRDARMHADVQNPPFEQAALAALLADRTVDRHVARMRRLYARRRGALLGRLAERLGGRIRVLGDESGLHVAVRVAGLRADAALVNRARDRGIALATAASHSLEGGRWEDTLLLGYGHLDEGRIASGVDLLAEFLGEP